jgi:hypothetical protein
MGSRITGWMLTVLLTQKKNYYIGEGTYFAGVFMGGGGVGIFSLAFTAVRCRCKPRYSSFASSEVLRKWML